MKRTRESVKSRSWVNVHGSLVWQKLIDFGDTQKFVPGLIEKVVVKEKGIGSIRMVYLKDGGEIIEKFTSISFDKMEMKFKIISTTMPVKNYEGIFTVINMDSTTCSVQFESIYEVWPEQKTEMNTAIKNFQIVFLSNLHK